MKVQCIKTNLLYFLSMYVFLISASSAQAELTATLKDVFMSTEYGSDFIGRVSSISGTETVTNDKGDIIADGSISRVGNWMGLNGKEGATFQYRPMQDKVEFVEELYVPLDLCAKQKPTSFVTLSFDGSNQWQVSKGRIIFLFNLGGRGSFANASLSDMYPTYPVSKTINSYLPESIVYASLITLPPVTIKCLAIK